MLAALEHTLGEDAGRSAVLYAHSESCAEQLRAQLPSGLQSRIAALAMGQPRATARFDWMEVIPRDPAFDVGDSYPDAAGDGVVDDWGETTMTVRWPGPKQVPA